MATKFIEIEGVYIEVDVQEGDTLQVSDDNTKEITDKTLDQMKGVLQKVAKHLKESWDEINKEVTISEAEVKLALGFEAEGNLFIAKGKTSSNIEITLKLDPK